MSDLQTLAQMRTAVRQRADQTNGGFVSDSELNTYINESMFELYDLLVTEFEDYYVANPNIISLVSGTDTYNLPADFYKLLGVDYQLDNTTSITLRQFRFAERNTYKGIGVGMTFGNYVDMKYTIFGNSLKLIPMPQTGSLQVWYIPKPTTLVADSDSFDGISGWTEYIVVDAAMKVLEKEETDTAALRSRKASLTDRIRAVAQNRDAGTPARVSDVSRNDDGFPLNGYRY